MEIETEKAYEIVKPLLEEVGVLADKNFLHDMQASSGLLLEKERDVWSFAHKTFQEYLTAVQWAKEKKCPVWNAETDQGDAWWHEAMRLYAAQADATQLLESCLRAESTAALRLAAECLEEALKMDKEVREKVQAEVERGANSEDLERMKLAAETRLKRRLYTSGHKWKSMNGKGEIDSEYITQLEYQLFLEEGGKYRQPDHWTELRFRPGEADEPIKGVRGTDAKKFCEWLSRREGGSLGYRVPTYGEVREYPAEGEWVELGEQCIVSNGEGYKVALRPAGEARLKGEVKRMSIVWCK